jgi:ribonuclease P protein subunit POP4
MMALTPESLPRHELNGLQVRVVESSDPGRTGIEGRVVVETAQTLHIEDRADGAPRVREVPKEGTTFEFELESDPSVTQAAPTAEAPEYVTVEGARLAARPARRTERTGEPRWR